MRRYSLECAITSSGVFIIRSSAGVSSTPQMLSTTLIRIVMAMVVCTAIWTFSFCCAP